MEIKKMNAVELLKKAEITKEDFKQEVVFKTVFNLINEMICEEDKLEREYDKLKQSRDTWEDIANNLRSDLELKINQLLRIKNIVEAYSDEAMNLFDQSNVFSGNHRTELLIEANTMAKIIEDLNLVFDGNVINHRFISIRNFIRNKLQETEEMQEYWVSIDTIRCWIDEYNNRA